MQPSAQPTELQSPAYLPSPHRRDSSQEHVATWQAQDSQARSFSPLAHCMLEHCHHSMPEPCMIEISMQTAC